jgi:hypothetical protein
LPIKKTIFQEEIAMSARTLQPTRRHAIFGGITAIGAGAAILGKAPLAFADSRLPVSSIEAVFGAPGEQEEGGVLHFDFARTDLAPVSLFGIALDSGIGFDTEINFQPVGNRAVVKWELCLLETEINPVIDGLFQTGLLPRQSAVNAIHNHFLQATPEVKFMHGTAFGDPVQIAQAWYQVLKANTGQPFETMPPGQTNLPNQQIIEIIGGTSSVSGIILNVEVPRRDRTAELGLVLAPTEQIQSLFSFQSIGNGQAAVDSEFSLRAVEVDAVCRTLRGSQFEIMAIHNHELFEEPDLYYEHAFNTGDPLELARAIRAALNNTNSAFKTS